jgi:MtN3 and saliva related transmembrane protein
MDTTMVLGLAAGTLTTISLIPQVIKTWKDKSAKDLSLGMFIAFCIGVALWLVYGCIVREVPIIVSNSVTLVLALAILTAKLKFG